MWALSLRLGLRPGEAAAIHWADVDLRRWRAQRPTTVQSDHRGAVSVVDKLKVESARRTLELPDDLASWLRDHRATRTVVGIDRDGLVFSRPDGQPLHPSPPPCRARGRCVRAPCRCAGGPTNQLRHSCVPLLIDQGAPIERVADLLGHNSTRMVDATYRHRLRPTVDVARTVDWSRTSGRFTAMSDVEEFEEWELLLHESEAEHRHDNLTTVRYEVRAHWPVCMASPRQAVGLAPTTERNSCFGSTACSVTTPAVTRGSKWSAGVLEHPRAPRRARGVRGVPRLPRGARGARARPDRRATGANTSRAVHVAGSRRRGGCTELRPAGGAARRLRTPAPTGRLRSAHP